MNRPLLAAGLMILAPALLGANAEFVTPLAGAQMIGIAPIEVRVHSVEVEKVTFFVDGAIVGIARSSPYRTMHDFGTLLKGHTVSAEIVAKGYSGVQRISVVTAAPGINDEIEVNLVEIPLRIRGGTPAASDLRISENGVRQDVIELRERRGETTFIFVLDRSLSMTGGKLDAALGAIRASLGGLRPGDNAELVLFDHRPHEPVPLSGRSGPGLIEPAGGTALRDTLAQIEPRRRSAIIVITDGGDRNSTTSDEQALRAVGRANGVVHALSFSGGSGADFLRDAAARTGGTSKRTAPATVAGDLERIIEDINGRYVAVYQSSVLEPGWRDIRVEASRRGLDVAASKRGYYAR